jgi:hypothetical protein
LIAALEEKSHQFGKKYRVLKNVSRFADWPMMGMFAIKARGSIISTANLAECGVESDLATQMRTIIFNLQLGKDHSPCGNLLISRKPLLDPAQRNRSVQQ